MSHLQELISRNTVHIVLQFYVLQFFCLSRTIAIGIPKTKTVRQKTVKQYVQYFLKLMPEDDS